MNIPSIELNDILRDPSAYLGYRLQTSGVLVGTDFDQAVMCLFSQPRSWNEGLTIDVHEGDLHFVLSDNGIPARCGGEVHFFCKANVTGAIERGSSANLYVMYLETATYIGEV